MLVDIGLGTFGPSFQMAFINSNHHLARKRGPIMREDDTTSRGNPSGTLKGVHQWAKQQVWVALSQSVQGILYPVYYTRCTKTFHGMGKDPPANVNP